MVEIFDVWKFRGGEGLARLHGLVRVKQHRDGSVKENGVLNTLTYIKI